MRFTLKQMLVFEAVADSGSVTTAADQVALSQSAASMALSQLEEALGKPLFDRQGKRLVLNQWGHWLRSRARRLLFDARQIELGFNGQHLLSGELSIGASQTVAERLLPDLISELDNDFPEMRIKLAVDNSEHVIAGLLNYHFAVGVIEGRCDDSQIKQEAWCKDHLVIVAAAHHPYAKLDRVSLAQLEAAKWVLREPGAGTREIFDSAIHGRLESLNVWREYSHVPVLISLVSRHVYLSCLPYRSVEDWVKAGVLTILPVPELNMERTFTFVWRKDAGENPLRDCVIKAAKRCPVKRADSLSD